jgi:hypothetical protein
VTRVRFAIAVVIALALAIPAEAQVLELGDEELRAEGWTFDDTRSTPGNIGAAAIAIFGGTLWHGVGHWMLGERTDAAYLLAAQAIGAVALSTGFAIRYGVSESPAAHSAGAAFAVTGGGLLAASWVADIVGAFKGTGDRLPSNTEEHRGFALQAAFETLGAPGVRAANFVTLALPLVGHKWRVEPFGELSIAADHWRAGARAEWRIPFGRVDGSHVAIGALGFEEQAPASGYGRTQLAATAGLRLDVGDVLPHLAGLTWTSRLDLAVDHYFFDATGNAHFRASDRKIHLPVETAVAFNVDPSVHLAFGYRHRRDALVGRIAPNIGALHARLGVHPWRRFAVLVELEQGAFTRASFGFRWGVARFGE